MPTVFYPSLDLVRINASGHRVVLASTTINAYNVTAAASLGTLASDSQGVVVAGSFTANPGDIVRLTHATYPGEHYITLKSTKDEAFTAAENAPVFVLENLYTNVNEARAMHFYAQDTDNPAAEPVYIGTGKPGEITSIPLQTSIAKTFNIFSISEDDYGTQEQADFRAMASDPINVPALVPPGSGVPDGDKGDITISGTGTVYTIDNNAVTNAKIANDAVTSAKIINDAVTTAKIVNDAVTNAKLANMAAATLKGSVAGGDPQDLTAKQARQVIIPYQISQYTSGSAPDFAAAQAAIGTVNPAVLRFDMPVTYAGGNFTFSDNIFPEVEQNGKLTVSNAATTVTFASPGNISESRQIFAGPGRVVFSKAKELHLEWWGGMVSAGASSDQAAFSQAFESMKLAKGGELILGPRVWDMHSFIAPKFGTITGSGQGLDMSAPWMGLGHREGTTIRLGSAGAVAILSLVDIAGNYAFRNLRVRNIGFTIENVSNARCVLAKGQYLVTETGYGASFTNCTFQGFHKTGAPASGQILTEIGSTPTEGWEAIGVTFKDCTWVVPAGQWAHRSYTGNCHQAFKDCLIICQPGGAANEHGLPGGNGIDIDGQVGWVTGENVDVRGAPGLLPSGYGYTEVFVRTLSNVTLTAYAGPIPQSDASIITINNAQEFTRNDLLKKYTFDANFPSAYIVQILSNKQAVLSWRPTNNNYSTYVGVSGNEYEYTTQPNIGGTSLRISGYGNSVHFKNFVDEGMDISLSFGGAGIYKTRCVFESCTPQGRIVFTSNGTFSSKDSTYYSCQLEDNAGDMIIESDGDVIDTATIVPNTRIINAEMFKKRALNTRLVKQTSIKMQRLSLGVGGLAEMADYSPFFDGPVVINSSQYGDSVISAGFPDKKVPLTVGHRKPFTANQPMIRLALFDPVTGLPTHWVDVQRNESNGKWMFMANQTNFERFYFNGPVEGIIEAYNATTWNNNPEFVTKDAFRDVIEALPSGGGVDTSGTPVAGQAAFFTDVDTIHGKTAGDARTALGLGTMATQNAATVAITGGSAAFSNEGFALKDTGNDNTLAITVDEDLTANRILTVLVNNANRTINLAGNLNVSSGVATVAGTNTGDNATNTQYSGLATSKQDTLVSGTNIKTLNSTSLLGSGNVAVQTTLVSGSNIKSINNASILAAGNLNFPTVLFSRFADATTSGTSEQTLYTNSIAANTLAADGDSISFEYAGSNNSNANEKFLKVTFAGTNIFYEDVTTELTIGSLAWKLQGTIVRVNSSTVRASVSFSYFGGTKYQVYTQITSLNLLSTGYDLVLRAATSDAAGDITARMGRAVKYPV